LIDHTILLKIARLCSPHIDNLTSRDAPDTGTDLAGYPANLKAGYRKSGEAGYQISGQISGRILYEIELNKQKSLQKVF
jgi:hypothetical protein